MNQVKSNHIDSKKKTVGSSKKTNSTIYIKQTQQKVYSLKFIPLIITIVIKGFKENYKVERCMGGVKHEWPASTPCPRHDLCAIVQTLKIV